MVKTSLCDIWSWCLCCVQSQNPVLEMPNSALTKDSFVRVFGTPRSHVNCRMTVSLVLAEDMEHAKTRAADIVAKIQDN